MDRNKHLISKYLDGELTPDEVLGFEEALAEDIGLRDELDLYREVDEAISDTEILDLRAQLDEIHEELSPQIEKRTRKSSGKVLRYAVAASIAVIISLGTYSLFFKKASNDKIVGQFYKPYDVTLVNRSQNTDITPMMREALFLYENGEYREAITVFEEIIETNEKMTASLLYSGISFMEIEEYLKARNSFQEVIDHNDNLYIEQAEWYLGMVFLLTDEKDKAKSQFEKIRKAEGIYQDEAAKILKKIRKTN